jgi:hypothetical protein
MENPWLNLPFESPYILEIDRDCIDSFNNAAGDLEKVIAESIPEPFIGNPHSAKLVLLNLNPGHAEDDETAHRDLQFRKAMFHNLHHKPQEFAFYPLNPKFGWTACGQWWLRHTKKLIDGLDRACVAQKLLVIEWFPYHSKKAGFNGNLVCESQHYSFQLAKEMLEKSMLVILRGRPYWVNVDPGFGKVPYHTFPLGGFIVPGAFKNPMAPEEDVFQRMRDTLKDC